MLLKIRNLGSDFMTITGGFLPRGGVTMIEPWEYRVWANDPSKNIEKVTDEEPKAKKKKK